MPRLPRERVHRSKYIPTLHAPIHIYIYSRFSSLNAFLYPFKLPPDILSRLSLVNFFPPSPLFDTPSKSQSLSNYNDCVRVYFILYTPQYRKTLGVARNLNSNKKKKISFSISPFRDSLEYRYAKRY